MSHMAGIQQEQVGLLKLFERKKFASLEEEVNSFASKHIEAKTGTEFRYGNIGLNIVGRILEVISKKKFDVLIIIINEIKAMLISLINKVRNKT